MVHHRHAPHQRAARHLLQPLQVQVSEPCVPAPRRRVIVRCETDGLHGMEREIVQTFWRFLYLDEQVVTWIADGKRVVPDVHLEPDFV